jgi:homoserine dehydrogenase
VNVAVLGAGAVGSAVAELAAEYGHTITGLADSTTGVSSPDGIDVSAALDRKADEGRVGTGTPQDVLDGSYDVLVEATPTTLGDAQPGFEHLRTALERDSHVVLANKGPVAQRYSDVRAAERDSEGAVRFEATVGGAIPVLTTVNDIGPDTVDAVRGVLNGTANFILTRMATEGLAYDHVLAEAKDLGVAEADPSFDVNGTDAALKCVILANVLGDPEKSITLDDATVEGIEDLPASTLELAGEDGHTVRLVGEVRDRGVRVGPRLIPEHGSLAVSGTQNVVQIETSHAGPLTLSGRGAGGPETASAVLADIGRLQE